MLKECLLFKEYIKKNNLKSKKYVTQMNRFQDGNKININQMKEEIFNKV